MTRTRSSQINPEATPYYHCVSRCVRRAFLCGDAYEHRRDWLESRLFSVAESFAIDLCAHAIMSNHWHVALHINHAKACEWSEDEVINRWTALYATPVLIQRKRLGKTISSAEQRAIDALVATWRERLTSISWFMKTVNEPIARQANAEDGCTGHFWESRFKSQALLDEAALAACLAYIDLNPIRAKMADTPETSNYTSIQKRINTLKQPDKTNPGEIEPITTAQPKQLFPFVGNPREDMPEGLPFRLEDYLELVEWSGRMVREDKRGAINPNLPPILQRLNINHQQWHQLSRNFESQFSLLVGSVNRIHAACELMGKQWAHGVSACRSLLPN